MNSKSFKSKEFMLYVIPVALVDILIYVALYRWVAGVFYYWDPADLVMNKPRTIYFLVVSYLIAVFIEPVELHKRGRGVMTVLLRTVVRTGIMLFLFAVSIGMLFGNFAGKLLLQFAIIGTLAAGLWHVIAMQAIAFARRHGRNKVHSVIVGASENALTLYRTLAEDGAYKVLGMFDDGLSAQPEGIRLLGSVDSLGAFLESNKVHSVYCGLSPASDEAVVNDIIRRCENLFIDFYYVPNMDGYLKRTMTFSQIGRVTLVNLREEPLANPVNAAVKRMLDILLSGIFLVTLFPIIWIFVAAGTKLSSPGPVFFKQDRTGYKGRSFKMYKFRSMRVNANADKLQATADDPRKTRFGDFLRRTSIDELPQFINVFKGDMSIIGPRPHMELHTEMYSKLVDEYLVRHMVKPGLTGWAQVNGCRGETREVSQMADRVRHDIWYVEHWSLWLDLRIFFMTIRQILVGDKQAY